MTDIISQPCKTHRTAKRAKCAKKNLRALRVLGGWQKMITYGTAVLVVWKYHTADQALQAPSVLQAMTRQ